MFGTTALKENTHLLSFFNPPNTADDDLVPSLERDHLCNAVGGAGVVDVPERKTKNYFKHQKSHTWAVMFNTSHKNIVIIRIIIKDNKDNLYLARPPVRVASTTCSLSMRNIKTARFCEKREKTWIKRKEKSPTLELSSAKNYLGSVNPLFPGGDFISEDGPVVLDHHGLFFNVSGSKQAQALRTHQKLSSISKRTRTAPGWTEADSPGCESGPNKHWLSTRSSSSGTARISGERPESCCEEPRLLLGLHSGWTWHCCSKQLVAVVWGGHENTQENEVK